MLEFQPGDEGKGPDSQYLGSSSTSVLLWGSEVVQGGAHNPGPKGQESDAPGLCPLPGGGGGGGGGARWNGCISPERRVGGV